MDFPTPEALRKQKMHVCEEDQQRLKQAIERQFNPGTGWGERITISVKSIKSNNSAVVALLRDHGWDCEYTSDQRDGDFYLITPA